MSFLKALNAGCQFPVASHASVVPATGSERLKFQMHGIYWQESSQKLLRANLQMEIPATTDNSWFVAQGESLAAQIKAQF
jgi:hydroxymethylbilane synthase